MQLTWIIDTQILQNTSYENLPDVIKEFDYNIDLVNYVPFMTNTNCSFPSTIDECVITYGTVNLIRKIPKYIGTYFSEKNMEFINYYSNSNFKDKFLNSDFIITSYADFKFNSKKYFELFNSNNLFIRPNSGIKIFSGTTIDIDGCNDFIRYANDLYNVPNTTLIILSSKKNFLRETRFFICDGKVIGSSVYNENGVHVEHTNVSIQSKQLADEIAKNEYYPDKVFVCDIADTNDGPKIIEYNSFACSGWYAADPKNIVKEVSEYTLRRFKSYYDR